MNTPLLQPGDILLYRVTHRSGFIANIIAIGEKILGSSVWKHSYSHIAIVAEDTNYIYESRWPKSQKTQLDWNYLNKKYVMELYRVKHSTPEKVEKVLDWCNNHLGIHYDLGLFFFGLFDKKNLEVCSTFVKKAWASANIELSVRPGKKLTTPDEIARNTRVLKRIK